MKNTIDRYSLPVRTAWICLAVMLVIFCGPVKRLLEQRFEPTVTNSSSLSFDKKLRTWYREKKEIAPLIQSTSQHTTDIDMLLFAAAALLVLSLLFSNNKVQKVYALVPSRGSNIPLYLYLKMLRV